MAKLIKYKLCKIVPYQKVVNSELLGEGVEPQYESCTRNVFTPISLPWSEKNEELAKREAHNGEYTIEDDGQVKTQAEQIAELKKQLSATDYQVIKCAECQLLGKEMPYDVAALHSERQAIRDRINQLEQGA